MRGWHVARPCMSERGGADGVKCDAELCVRETGCAAALLRKLEVVQTWLREHFFFFFFWSEGRSGVGVVWS